MEDINSLFHVLELDERKIKTLMEDWIRERYSPNLLNPKINVTEILALIEDRESEIEDNKLSGKKEINDIYDTEVHRLKYILNSYQRIRLFKIEQYGFFFESNKEELKNLSKTEKKYHKKYHKIEKSLYEQILPRNENVDLEQMNRMPDYSQYVFCKMLKDKSIFDEEDNELMKLEKDMIYIVRYKNIQSFINDGDCKLI